MLRFVLLLSAAASGLLSTYFVDAAEKCACECDKSNLSEVDASSYIFDDFTLRKLEIELAVQNATYQELRHRMDALTALVNKQDGILSTLREKLEGTNANKNADKIVDVRYVFNPTPAQLEQSTTCASKTRWPQSCAEATANSRKSGLYTIQDDLVGAAPFWVSCDEDGGVHGGGWTVIQRRQDGTVDFYRDWAEYKRGFGKINGEFFIGLDKLHALTTRAAQELLILMDDFDGVRKYAKYDAFAVGNEDEAYALKVLGNYSGDAGDSLTAHVANKFSTKDRDNDNHESHCAQVYVGAWWHDKCHVSNLNGKYLRGAYTQDKFAKGVVWKTFRGYNYALKYVQMMIRPRRE